jgi:hypothetical protein
MSIVEPNVGARIAAALLTLVVAMSVVLTGCSDEDPFPSHPMMNRTSAAASVDRHGPSGLSGDRRHLRLMRQLATMRQTERMMSRYCLISGGADRDGHWQW